MAKAIGGGPIVDPELTRGRAGFVGPEGRRKVHTQASTTGPDHASTPVETPQAPPLYQSTICLTLLFSPSSITSSTTPLPFALPPQHRGLVEWALLLEWSITRLCSNCGHRSGLPLDFIIVKSWIKTISSPEEPVASSRILRPFTFAFDTQWPIRPRHRRGDEKTSTTRPGQGI